MNGGIRLGLSLPVFLGSLIAMFVGTFTGLLGIWLFLAWKIAVPEWIKVGHAHASWWSVLLVIAALLVPGLPLRPGAKRFITITALVAVPLWLIELGAYYVSKVARGALPALPPRPGEEFSPEYLAYGTGIFVTELWFFAALLLVFLTALGIRQPRLTQGTAAPSARELLTDIEIPRQAVLVPVLVMPLGLIVGWAMTLAFKARGLPIQPAALVQLHSHTFFFIVGYLMTLIVMRAVGASERIFRLTFRLGQVAIPLIVLGYLLFIGLRLPSVAVVIPALLYFVVLGLGLAALFGGFGVGAKARRVGSLTSSYLRKAMAFTWALMILLVAVGPVMQLRWDTAPDVTVTYRQPEGAPYPGPYPEKYIGTAPVAGTPRGLENLHLSPGSWTHAALFWLLALLLAWDRIGPAVGAPGLLFLAATTIPLAPFFNAVGRVAAWANLPNGSGALWFAGHPLKMFNQIVLIVLVATAMRKIKAADR